MGGAISARWQQQQNATLFFCVDSWLCDTFLRFYFIWVSWWRSVCLKGLRFWVGTSSPYPKKPTSCGRVLWAHKFIYLIGSRRSCVVRVPYALPPVRHPPPFTFPPDRPRRPWSLMPLAGAAVFQTRSVTALAPSGSQSQPDVPVSLWQAPAVGPAPWFSSQGGRRNCCIRMSHSQLAAEARCYVTSRDY